ncbi:MAG: hypothetical protein U0Q18_25240, partial [Bryobacteraceae bacterium]
MPFITQILNAALASAMRNELLSNRDRVCLFAVRSSWGEWRAEIADNEKRRLALPDRRLPDPEKLLHELLFGASPCPFCNETANPDLALIAGCRWHRHCVALVYASEAITYGNEEQRAWA